MYACTCMYRHICIYASIVRMITRVQASDFQVRWFEWYGGCPSSREGELSGRNVCLPCCGLVVSLLGLPIEKFGFQILARAEIWLEISAPLAPSSQLSSKEYTDRTLRRDEIEVK